jgi:hypothetical protein
VCYYGYRSLVLENEAVRVVVTPDVGAKIMSLYDRRVGRQWLVTPEQSGRPGPNVFRAWPYGTEYNPNQSGGWDEMIPTILACSYPAEGPYKGEQLPDHGEAWTLPWQLIGAASEGDVVLELAGKALPYLLRRTLSLRGDTLTLAYTLANESDGRLAYLWAAHPQFACDPGATIVLPTSVTEVVNALPAEWGPEFGGPGTINPWPCIEVDGQPIRQDQVAGPGKHGGRKFYLRPDEPVSCGELRQPSGEWLRMSWDPAFAPYCGVWIDEGYLNSVSDMAFEPTTGYYDSLDTAWANGRCSMLAPSSSVSWELRVQVGVPVSGGTPGGE